MKKALIGCAGLLVLLVGGAYFAFWVKILHPHRVTRAYLDHCVQELDKVQKETGHWPKSSAALIQIAGQPPKGIGTQEFYSVDKDKFYFHFRWENRPDGSCLTFRSYDRAWRFYNGKDCNGASAANPKMTCDPNPFFPSCQVPLF